MQRQPITPVHLHVSISHVTLSDVFCSCGTSTAEEWVLFTTVHFSPATLSGVFCGCGTNTTEEWVLFTGVPFSPATLSGVFCGCTSGANGEWVPFTGVLAPGDAAKCTLRRDCACCHMASVGSEGTAGTSVGAAAV